MPLPSPTPRTRAAAGVGAGEGAGATGVAPRPDPGLGSARSAELPPLGGSPRRTLVAGVREGTPRISPPIPRSSTRPGSSPRRRNSAATSRRDSAGSGRTAKTLTGASSATAPSTAPRTARSSTRLAGRNSSAPRRKPSELPPPHRRGPRPNPHSPSEWHPTSHPKACGTLRMRDHDLDLLEEGFLTRL